MATKLPRASSPETALAVGRRTLVKRETTYETARTAGVTQELRDALTELVRLDDEAGGLFIAADAASELVIALDKARLALNQRSNL